MYQDALNKLIEIKFAFKKDCENLLEKFAQNKSHDYGKFVEIWKEMHFSLVYKGVQDMKEITKETELFLFEAKKYFIFAPDIYIKTGALYLLYGLYYKQPLKEVIKIRLTHDEVNSFKDYTILMKGLNEPHPMYIYSKLIHDQAFDYVYIQVPLVPKRFNIIPLFNMVNDTFKEDTVTKITNDIKEIIRNENISDIGSDYEASLKEYFDANGGKTIMTFEMDIQKELKRIFTEDKSEDDVKNDLNENIGEKRNKLKKKAACTFK